MSQEPVLSSRINAERLDFTAAGSWTTAHSGALEHLVDEAVAQVAGGSGMTVNMAGVQELDTLGAWLLERLIRGFRERGRNAGFIEVPERFRGLLEEMHEINRKPRAPLAQPNRIIAALDRIGRTTVSFRVDILAFLEMLGDISVALLRVLVRPFISASPRRCTISVALALRRCQSSC